MSFINWLKENYNYTGDGSVEDIESTYSFSEIDTMYEEYSNEGWNDI